MKLTFIAVDNDEKVQVNITIDYPFKKVLHIKALETFFSDVVKRIKPHWS